MISVARVHPVPFTVAYMITIDCSGQEECDADTIRSNIFLLTIVVNVDVSEP